MSDHDESAADGGRSPLRVLLSRAAPYRRQLALILLFAALGTAASLVEPLVYRMAIDDVAGIFVRPHSAHAQAPQNRAPAAHQPGLRAPAASPPASRPPAPHRATSRKHRRGHLAPRTAPQALRTLLFAVAVLFATSMLAQLFELLADNRSARVANRIEQDLIGSTFGHVLHFPLRYFSGRASGALAKQIDQSDAVAPIVTAFTKELAPALMRLVGVIAIMVTQNARLTLVALATLPPYFWLSWRASRDLETNLPRYYDLWEEVSARIQQALGAIKTVKLAGAEEREVQRFGRVAGAAYETYLERNRLANRYAFFQVLFAQLGKALVFGYGGWKALQHQLTPGDVVMFVAYLSQLYDPVDSLTTIQTTIQQQLVSLRRAIRLLGTREREPRGGRLDPGPGRVELQDVRFSYVPDREVLRGVSCVLEPGRVTALVGPSGAGKTTLADLLLRLYEPTAGAIFIDGQDLSATDPAAVRAAVSVVSVDAAIFRGTLRENICYLRPDATDGEVRSAAIAAGLERTLQRLPQGLDTQVGESGVGLSVGERQRVQLARVLTSRARILILDEATANLDYATELEVKESLAHVCAGRTTLVISHRYSMVADADRVLVLDGGRIIESGSPAELLVEGGWFARWSHAAAALTGASDAPAAG